MKSIVIHNNQMPPSQITNKQSILENRKSETIIPLATIVDLHLFFKTHFMITDHSPIANAIDIYFRSLIDQNISITADQLIQSIKMHVAALNTTRIWLKLFTQNRGLRLSNQIADLLSFDNNNLRLVDVGCADGGMLQNLSKMSAWQGDLIGLDIVDHCPPGHSFKFYKIDPKNSHFPIPTGTVNVVTMIMLLHHSANSTQLILEANRILTSDGLLIVKEHNAESSQKQLYFEIVDRILSEVLFRLSRPATFNYKGLKDWIATIEPLGFKLVRKIEIRDDGFLIFVPTPIANKIPHKLETKTC